MNAQERHKKIQEILGLSPVAKDALRIPYQGETMTFDVFKIPIEFLVFNKENGRIASVVKSYIKEHQNIDVETEEGSKLIAQFLYEAHKERNEITKSDLITNGQLQYGIVTSDGVIVDGNRRASLLLSISKDSNQKQEIRDRCGYFLAAVLPEQADQKDILRLETQYQLASDGKVDYNPIEKYLHAVDMKNEGFTVDEIKSYMGFKTIKDVDLSIEMVSLFDNYLESYDYEGLYTRIPAGAEDRFLKLNEAIKRIKQGAISWIQNEGENGKDVVINDLKTICFDFIRLGEQNVEQYRSIMQGKNCFLMNERIWTEFKNNYFEKSDKFIEEEPTEKALTKSKSIADSERILKARDNKWKDNVREVISDVYIDAKTTLDNVVDKDKPLKLIKKAESALSAIDFTMIKRANNKKEISSCLDEVETLLNQLKENLY